MPSNGRFFTEARFALLREATRRHVRVEPAQSASMTVFETRLTDREQAYAFAIEIMNRADETWPAS